ncbi:MAG: radical SAM protein [Oscillospiraceae bacterium]|nr:radical SAM protein [Oscillospiraceae bacterium]
MMDYIISITNKCNLRCRYCYEKKLNTVPGSLSDETAQKTIEFINARNNAERVYLFGGEPLLYKDVVKKLVSGINAKSYIITTNGMLLDEDFIKWCVRNKVIINLSHDGMDCSQRGIDVNELNVKLRVLLKYQPDTLVQMVYNEDSLDMLAQNVLYFKNLGVRKVSASMDSFLVSDDPDRFADRMMEEWEKVSKIKDMFIYQLDEKERTVKNGKSEKCEICKRKMFINWDAKIYPCVQFQNLPAFQCGDIFSGLDPEQTVISHPDYSSLSTRCDGCEIKEYCHNSCACRKMSSTGGLRDISEAVCIEEQVLIFTALKKITIHSLQEELK